MTLRKKPIPKALKCAVWEKYVGEDIGKILCMCCEITEITQMKFHCGHIIAEAMGGETNVNNLLPICESCNKSMGTKNLNDFKKLLKDDNKKIKKNQKDNTQLKQKLIQVLEATKKCSVLDSTCGGQKNTRENQIIKDTYNLFFSSKKYQFDSKYTHDICGHQINIFQENTMGGHRRMLSEFFEHIPCLCNDEKYLTFMDKKGYLI